MFKKNKKLRQIGAALLAAAMLATALAGCSAGGKGKSETGAAVNDTYDEKKPLLTVSGQSVQPNDDRLSLFPELGFGLLVPDEWMDLVDSMTFVSASQSYCIGFLPPSLVPNFDDMSEEELEAFDGMALYEKQLPFIKILYANSQEAQASVQKENGGYEAFETLAALGKNTYYIAYNTSLSASEHPELTDKDMETFEKLASSIEKLKNGVVIFPIQTDESTAIPSDVFQSLQASDMAGNKVSSSIFESYDLTAVNIWATWCGPCVSEMPDLVKLHKGLPENVNFITICADGAEEKEAANQILSEAGSEFTTLAGDEAMRNGLLANIFAYPTTLFVDKNGNVVGAPLVGAWSCEEYMQEIETRLGK